MVVRVPKSDLDGEDTHGGVLLPETEKLLGSNHSARIVMPGV